LHEEINLDYAPCYLEYAIEDIRRLALDGYGQEEKADLSD